MLEDSGGGPEANQNVTQKMSTYSSSFSQMSAHQTRDERRADSASALFPGTKIVKPAGAHAPQIRSPHFNSRWIKKTILIKQHSTNCVFKAPHADPHGDQVHSHENTRNST